MAMCGMNHLMAHYPRKLIIRLDIFKEPLIDIDKAAREGKSICVGVVDDKKAIGEGT